MLFEAGSSQQLIIFLSNYNAEGYNFVQIVFLWLSLLSYLSSSRMLNGKRLAVNPVLKELLKIC